MNKHILYDNFMFYKLDTEKILEMIKDQERLCEIVKILGVDEEKVEYIFYKRDCLFFELHRRSFTCCIFQMYAKHKVNSWLKYVEDDIRCECCKMEYYEFNSDLAKVEKGLLELTETMSLLISSRAFEGGRTLESPYTQFVAALPATSSSSNDSLVQGSIYFSVTQQPIPYLDIDNDENSKETQDSSDASSTEENQCLLNPAEEKKKADAEKPPVKTRTRVTAPPSSTSSEEVAQKPKRTLKDKFLPFFPLAKPRKLFAASKNTEDGPSCSYQKLNQGKRSKGTSAKTTDTADGNSARENNPAETKTSPAWSFAWRFFRQ